MLKRLIKAADELEEIWWDYAPVKLKTNVYKDELSEVKRQHKISICTTCMNRLDDLKQTLPQNILDNADYTRTEFVLIDYNSSDGLPKQQPFQKQPILPNASPSSRAIAIISRHCRIGSL